MVKKTLGYVELEWACPRCGTRNPGPEKACASCGAAQPKGVAFQQKAEEELITDEAEIARAKAGPDVHCPFCSARNPAGAERCTQCNAILNEAVARESGQVLGAHRDGPAEEVKCPRCGASNDANALKCTQCNASLPAAAKARAAPARRSLTGTAAKKPRGKLSPVAIVAIGVFGLMALAVCVFIVLSLIPSGEVTGVVQSVSWTRSIEIQALQDVTKEAWRNDVPANARLGTCTKKLHHTQDNPAPGAEEVCGTPYTVDKGTGHGEVVQDCEYKVYADWCRYTVQEWRVIDTASLSGADYSPQWPRTGLAMGQREGERSESYKVVFDTEKKTYTYSTSGDRFRDFQVGSRWVLRTSALGGIKSVEPAR
jgi:hypothetical protein